MVRHDREKLSDIVEVYETYIGGERLGKHGRGAENKTLVIIAAEDTPSTARQKNREVLTHQDEPLLLCHNWYTFGLLLTTYRSLSNSLIEFIKTHVSSDSTIRTDGWLGYEPLVKFGYKQLVDDSNSLTIAYLIAALLSVGSWVCIGTTESGVFQRFS